MITVRLAVREGGHVADVIIPPFKSFPDVLLWGERVFTFHQTLSNDGDPAVLEYREAFAYFVPPGMTKPDPTPAPAGA